MKTTVGQLLINQLLPEEMRDYRRVLDKAGLKSLLQELYDKDSSKYREVVHKLSQLGATAVYHQAHSVSIKALKSPVGKKAIIKRMRLAVNKAVKQTMLSDDRERRAAVAEAVQPFLNEMKELVQTDGIETNNPFSLQVASGSRGNIGGMNSLRGTDMLYTDSSGQVIPVPVEHSYSEGLDPAEYWAGSYGARTGMIDVKMATAKAGFFGKQISQAAHRLVVTEQDCGTEAGIPVPTEDTDNIGALLASSSGDYGRNDTLSARSLKNLKKSGAKTLILRSPITCQAKNGVCAKCVGVRERGKLPDIGDNVGISAAQSLSERLSQGMLSSKHSGGVLGSGKVTGFDLVNQLIQVPKVFKGGASVSELDGRVSDIQDAPQGGKYITVGDITHYVQPELDPTVKIGDTVEAGDVLSEGIPNPSKIVYHKGMGEGRLYFTNQFRKAFHDSGMAANRRNIEFLARGLINHVRVTDEDAGDDVVPDDLVEYDSLVKHYQPRIGATEGPANRAKGRYLEKPVLHYSIGTRITPSVMNSFKEHKIGNVWSHSDEPSFQPEMRRAMENLTTTPDWQTRLGGFYIGKGLRTAVQRGSTSTTEGESFIPRVAQGKPLYGREKSVKISPVL